MELATIYTDKFTGKQYRVLNTNSARVQQYPAGLTIWYDGSIRNGGSTRPAETNMGTRANLNSWLRMMGFK